MNGVGAFLKDAWRLARPYFVESEERWSARGLLAAVIALNLSTVGLSVLLNFWRGAFYTSLGEKDWNSFINLILFWNNTEKGLTFGFTLLAFTHVAIVVIENYLQQLLQIRWRRWMTRSFVNDWMADQAYYKISLTGGADRHGTDNPDQRITEDIRDFCEIVLLLGVGLISRIVTLMSFFSILWGLSAAIEILGVSVPGCLVWVALIYALLGTIATHLTGRPLSALIFNQQRAEADFRYSLFRVRENVEGVALYGGEEREKAGLMHRFTAVFGNFRAIMVRSLKLNSVTSVYGQAGIIFPYILAAPGYFAGKFAQGVIFQTADAFGQVERALSWIVDRYEELAKWRAMVERLSTFHGAIETARAVDNKLVRGQSLDGAVRLTGMDLLLPNGTKLLEHANLTLTPGHSVVITGRSGSGKSTLFRLLSGIWPFAQGEIQVPADMFFLPQKPYIPLGTLRYVIAYPHDPDIHDSSALSQALRDAGLDNLIDRLDRDDNWPQSLSGGEQQRVAIARALLAKPAWIFMDEATSNLDPESETAVYRMLRSRLPDTNFISIAHRPSVAGFHEARVTFQRDGQTPGTLVAESGA